MAPITLISTLPTFVSVEEHKNLVTSTPASFSDIPPVLRHKEENVSVTLDPAVEGLTAEDCANGTLYVIESVLAFISSSTARGFQVEYPAITLHAVSRAENGPSIYCQLDEQYGTSPAQPQETEDEVSNMRELIIVPKDASALEPIFEALSLCASLHPDPATENDMDEDEDAFIDADESAFETFTGDEGQEFSEVGRAALAHLESIIYDPFDKSSQETNADEHDTEEENKKQAEDSGEQKQEVTS